MSSASSGGASVITLQFSLDLSLDSAEQEVQTAINAASSFLPVDLPMPPVYSKVNPADTPIVTLAVSSPTLPLTRVEDLVDTRLAPKLSEAPGVGLVSLGRTTARGSYPGGSDCPRFQRIDAGGRAHGHFERRPACRHRSMWRYSLTGPRASAPRCAMFSSN